MEEKEKERLNYHILVSQQLLKVMSSLPLNYLSSAEFNVGGVITKPLPKYIYFVAPQTKDFSINLQS
jgi:hypothetical protein